METFLENLDMNNLRTIIEEDSDYGDENEKASNKGAVANLSLSVSSM